MKNGEIILRKTDEGANTRINATPETALFLLAALITDICEKTVYTVPTFIAQLELNCAVFEQAKKQSENEA